MANQESPCFSQLGLLARKVYIHRNDFATQKLSGFTKETGRLKLMKACETSKLKTLEKNVFTVNSEYNYLQNFQSWTYGCVLQKKRWYEAAPVSLL